MYRYTKMVTIIIEILIVLILNIQIFKVKILSFEVFYLVYEAVSFHYPYNTKQLIKTPHSELFKN
jgi:hypothetical protein